MRKARLDIRSTKQRIAEIVATSLSNKHDHIDASQRSDWIERSIELGFSADAPELLLDQLREINRPEDDFHNQAILLSFISQFPDHHVFSIRPLEKLHEMALGQSSSQNVRETEFIEDFGGNVPTSVEEASSRIDEIERLMVASKAMAYPGDRNASILLAHIFSAIIRVHYFQDGNGRTARMATQLLLSSWGEPLITIPKVRNDPSWKTALKRSFESGTFDLAEAFYERVEMSS